MKRSNQLHSAPAVVLNASPSPRQADRLAAPLRRRGAWTQFVEARLREPVGPERDPTEPPASRADKQPTIVSDDPSVPGSELTNEVHPPLDVEQPLQPIVLPQEEISRRLSEAAENIGRRTDVTRPDAGADDETLAPAFDRNDVSAEESDSRTQPAPPDADADPAHRPEAESAVAPYTPEAAGVYAPEAAEANFAAQEQQTMLVETLIADELQYSPPDRRFAASEWRRVRNFAWFLAPTTILLAIGTGILLRGNLASLSNTPSQAVSHSKATPIQSPPQSRPKLKPAIPTFVHRTPIEAVSTTPPARALPTTYGIFASSSGRMIRLEPMNIRLPDSRIALSMLITKPGTVVVPHGPLSFVAYQRELMTSAPDNAQLRILARVARTPSSAATATANDGWAIRSVSVDLTVAPVPENREMVELQPVNPDLVLSPGRYVLVFKNQAYDFVVAGKVTDKAHCLERTETPDGDRFTECRKLP